MYFAVGWPKYYGVNDVQTGQPCGFKFNRDRSILAVLTEDRLTLWHFHVSTLFEVTNYHDHEILEAPVNVNHPPGEGAFHVDFRLHAGDIQIASGC